MTTDRMLELARLLKEFRNHMRNDYRPEGGDVEDAECEILNLCGDVYMCEETDEEYTTHGDSRREYGKGH